MRHPSGGSEAASAPLCKLTYNRILGALVPLLALVCFLSAPGAMAAENFGCRIDTQPSARLIKLSAVAIALIPATGTFEFEVVSRSAAGKTVSRQSGKVKIGETDAREIVVSRLAISKGDFQARLKIELNGEPLACSLTNEDLQTPPVHQIRL